MNGRTSRCSGFEMLDSRQARGLARFARSLPVLVAMFVALPALAEDTGGQGTVFPPRVTAATLQSSDKREAGFGDGVTVEVKNLSALLDEMSGNCGGIVLFIDGMAIKGLPPESCTRDGVNGTVRYRLARTEKSGDVWNILLGRPTGYTRPVSVSVGAGDQFPIPTNVVDFQLRVLRRAALLGFLAVSLAMLATIVWLCRNTGLIRGGLASIEPHKRPYSLSLFQMAFWLVLVINAYVFIWIVNGETDTITDSILGLLGIGAGTALGAALIDTNKQARSETGSTVKPEESRGFLRDVLSSDDDINFHRVQLFAWTVVLGIIFCSSVYRYLAMPSFSATLLGLMGISSGTYLGFKLPEKVGTGTGDVPASAAEPAAAQPAPAADPGAAGGNPA
ncbi:MAG TPA: hypothetical protein VK447_07070 [Myxococcaceae bacterium]|nr:hypothetical protein [Myxococcaceae bacterium]